MFLWILFIVLLALLALYYLSSPVVRKPYLWTYWENRNGRKAPPAHIQLCLDSLRHRCALTFEVVVLDPVSVPRYLPNLRTDLNRLLVAQKVDYIRIALLERYGGVWVDADTIMLSDLGDLATKLRTQDFLGYGCTGEICHFGKPRPSNWVMGSRAGGRLITRIRQVLDQRLDQDQKEFHYHELGKEIIWRELSVLMKEGYDYHHYPSEYDGSRDVKGHWLHSPQHLSTEPIEFKEPEKLQFAFLANAELMGDARYTWVMGLTKEELLNGPWNLSRLFRRALTLPEPITLRLRIINLVRRSDRRRTMTTLLRATGLKAEFFDAIDGTQLTKDDVKDYVRRDPSLRALHRNEIACAFSHIAVWRDFLDTQEPYMLVLEDDVNLVRNFHPLVQSLLRELEATRKEWEFLYLGCHWFDRKPTTREAFSARTYSTDYVGFGTYGYILTRAGAQKLIEQAYPLNAPLDDYTQGMCNRQRIKGLIADPMLVTVDYSQGSDIPRGKRLTAQDHATGFLIT
jgi:GR25 family glycosyltransferase involved in LPS biosynthesis